MINQVTNSTNSNVFKPMQSNGLSFDVSQPYYQKKNKLEENKKERKSHKLGITIATSVIGISFGLIAFAKAPKKISQKFLELLNSTKHKSTNIKSYAKYANFALNITTLKDVLFKRVTDKIPAINKACQKLTDVFGKIAIKSAQRKYSKASTKFSKLYMGFAEANSKIASSKQVEVEKLNKQILEFQKNLDSDFGANTTSARMLSSSEKMNSLYDKFVQKTIGNSMGERVKVLKQKETYNTFIAEKLVENDKTTLAATLKTSLNQKKEAIDKIMENYKKILPEKDYLKLQKTADKAYKKLDSAVKTESDNLFDKIRDIKLGSAPTDCLSIVAGFATAGFGIAHADNRDERITAALQYGIPAIGAVTISLLCTTSLIAAGPSLAIGMISGVAINKLGEFVNKKRKQIEQQYNVANKTTKPITSNSKTEVKSA